MSSSMNFEKALRSLAGSPSPYTPNKTLGKCKTVKDDLSCFELGWFACPKVAAHELTTGYVRLLGKKLVLRDSRPLACHCPKGTLHPSLFPQARHVAPGEPWSYDAHKMVHWKTTVVEYSMNRGGTHFQLAHQVVPFQVPLKSCRLIVYHIQFEWEVGRADIRIVLGLDLL